MADVDSRQQPQPLPPPTRTRRSHWAWAVEYGRPKRALLSWWAFGVGGVSGTATFSSRRLARAAVKEAGTAWGFLDVRVVRVTVVTQVDPQ